MVGVLLGEVVRAVEPLLLELLESGLCPVDGRLPVLPRPLRLDARVVVVDVGARQQLLGLAFLGFQLEGEGV